ncbi:hypothetical protein J6590_051401 [Homalodisca vitripennis]|nr:hypothetical protein J6590_051401 [Homalodisca vitripennis]
MGRGPGRYAVRNPPRRWILPLKCLKAQKQPKFRLFRIVLSTLTHSRAAVSLTASGPDDGHPMKRHTVKEIDLAYVSSQIFSL